MVLEAITPGAPFERSGHLTFGSFNAALKITPAMCRRWAELLTRLPESRLLVANSNSRRKREAILRELEAGGVATDRVEFTERVPLDKYLALYNRVDIALDSFPYGGGTTTLDALWMGAPVAATLGPSSVSRSAASVLAELGLDDWIAPSIDAFVDTVVARAADRDALRALRRDLRPRLQASPLTDVPRFARDLEAAYRAMRMAAGA
jgi:predicted O-linked N-acetylglucosamine transferase (SPINDLY family)